MAVRVHPVSGYYSPMRGRPLRISARRDLGPALDILPALLDLGFARGEPILETPPPDPQDAGRYSESPFEVDYPFVQVGDTLLMTTRWPLDDHIELPRKQIRRSFTDLEKRLFNVWPYFLDRCARSHVRLHPRFHQCLAPSYENRRWMKFFEAEGAPYKELNDCAGSGWRKPDPGMERRTAVFLLRLNEAWQGGPGLVSAFGLDGTATTVWGYRLGRDCSHLLAKPGFVMAEMSNTGIPERPLNMLWADRWEIKVILHETWTNVPTDISIMSWA